MNRTTLQAIAMLMITAAISFTAAEWRWKPANAEDYLAIVKPPASAAVDNPGSVSAFHER